MMDRFVLEAKHLNSCELSVHAHLALGCRPIDSYKEGSENIGNNIYPYISILVALLCKMYFNLTC